MALCSSVSPILISRFKEREENVKTDIFAVYISLLRHTRPVSAAMMDIKSVASDHPATLLMSQLPAIVKSVTRQLKEKSVKTRQVVATPLSCWTVCRVVIVTVMDCCFRRVSPCLPSSL